MSTATEDDIFAEAGYTAAFRARCRLDDMTVAPDPTICHADEFPVEFAALMNEWNRCLNAAGVVQSRYDADTQHGGIIATVAGKGRAASLRELSKVWKGMCDNYIAATLDATRRVWDCLFCGNPVDPAAWGGNLVDADRCPNCYCILWMNRAETDWTNEWEDC